MKFLRSQRKRSDHGSILGIAVLFSGILAITVAGIMSLSMYRIRAEANRAHSNQAYYHAENALNWACQVIADASAGGTNASFVGNFSATETGHNGVSIPYLKSMAADSSSGLENAWVNVS